MSFQRFASNSMHCLRIGLTSLALFQFSLGGPLASSAQAQSTNDGKTTSPIKHVIVIIGENRSYDHVFATYVPKAGQTTMNLLSEGIIKADGTPGLNFAKAHQLAAVDLGEKTGGDPFLLDPPKVDFGGDVLPAPLVGGAFDSYIPSDSLSLAMASENGLPTSYYPFLVSGGTGLTSHTPDTRITNVNALPAGPFQLTNTTQGGFDYNAYAASPVHRFYQMWQQLNCDANHIVGPNGYPCTGSLFSWVEVTVGAGTNGLAQPADFNTEYTPGSKTTGEGSTALGFYNMQQGDVPYFKSLADTYAISDNFHQSVQGGTGANHIMFGHGDAIWFSDGKGNALTPPHNPASGQLNEVENPNPAIGTNNWYTEDGYGGGSFGSPAYGGGSYSNCADPTQPGVSTVVKFLASLPKPVDPRCEAGHYYLLNNYNPGYFGRGENAYTDASPDNTIFTIPPSSTPSIGDDLIAHNVSWKYYGDQWNAYAGNGNSSEPVCAPPTVKEPCYIPEDKYQLNYGAVGSPNAIGVTIQNADEYCNICNPFQYDTSIMANAAVRGAHIKDTGDLYNDIVAGDIPAVSIVKPSGFTDGHPASSKLNLFEGFCKKIIDAVQANPTLWANTAIFITEDEGGGYYDSGYVQPLDFFGDGTRIIFLAVSPFTTGGKVAHNYADHVSILKFIERNWSLPPVTSRSRDNFPNPVTATSPYIPTNGPAISDLFELFDFK
jgi:phospholipase C